MKKYFFLFVSILLTLSSCLTILHPLVTADNIITDRRIEGTWTDSDSKSILVQRLMNSKMKDVFTNAKSEHWEYTKKDSAFYTKLYIITFREKDLDYTWIAGLVKIKDQFYLTLSPEECLSSNGKEAYDLKRTKTASSVAKLTWKNNNSLSLGFLNGDHLKQIILNGKAKIKHEYDPLFGTFVITASSAEISQFLEKYGTNETLFKGGNAFTLTRKM